MSGRQSAAGGLWLWLGDDMIWASDLSGDGEDETNMRPLAHAFTANRQTPAPDGRTQ